MKWNIIHLKEIDSTNTEVRRQVLQEAREGLVVTAERQTAGKGRRGRTWESKVGDNLYFSMLLRPNLPVEKAPMLTLVMALSVAKAIEKLYGMESAIKWPNDLVLSGKKICGILTEMHMSEGRIEDVIVGTGINVNQEVFSGELEDKATSLLLEIGNGWLNSDQETINETQKLDKQKLLDTVLDEFAYLYDTFLKVQDLSFLQEEYDRRLINKNKEVLVLEPGNEYTAVARGINSVGELLVEREDGSIEAVYAGEVSVRGIYGYV